MKIEVVTFIEAVADIADRHGWQVRFERPPLVDDGTVLGPGKWQATIPLTDTRGTYYATVQESDRGRIKPEPPPVDPLAPKAKAAKPKQRMETPEEYTTRLHKMCVNAMISARKQRIASWITETADTSMAGYRLPMIRRRPPSQSAHT